ncbi:TIGR00282 family metallophosphoesterase [Minwuia sp.]|uniref:TIGR00282 family metallophosphoesterase n=1 Tax=Minwuia sp. TaxID=2493630 RepID=UPI003A94095D
MKVLYLGDLVGRSGREAAIKRLPELRERLKADFVVVNGENAAGGFGITPAICDDLFAAGTDVIVTGNHVWDNRDILPHFQRENRLLRPANFPEGAPGRGIGVYDVPGGRRIAVAQVMGRIFMDAMDCPFRAVDKALAAYPLGRTVQFTLVDVHAEATSEKMAMGHHLDGRATMVVGTHTHAPTADHQIFSGGTAYMSDIGMCGDYDSVIGMQKAEPIRRFIHKTPGARFAPADGEATVCGVFVESDDKTGLATRIDPVRVGPRLAETMPEVV